jgi:predicted nucleic acid-binding protein
VWRLLRGQEAPQWRATLKAGLIALCPVVKTGVLQAVQSTADGMRVSTLLNSLFGWVPCPEDPWQQIIGIQHDLIKIGHNRGPGAIDILVALTAAQRRLTCYTWTTISRLSPKSARTSRSSSWNGPMPPRHPSGFSRPRQHRTT